VRTGSVPFVLKFVQQALRLLWSGLDKVQPHESVGEDIWRDVAPADLGEMAADVEMQQHFIIKKRPIAAITEEPYSSQDDVGDALAAQIEALESPSGTHSVRSIYTGAASSSDYGEEILPSPIQPIHYQTFESVQNHIQDAIKSVADMQPVHQHVATNATGSKRAHVFHQDAPQQPFPAHQFQQQQSYVQLEQTYVQQQEMPRYAYDDSQGCVQQQGYQQHYQQQQPQEQQYQQQQQQQPQQQQYQQQQQPQQQQYQQQQQPQQQQYQHHPPQQVFQVNDGFLPAVSAPLPLPMPLPPPSQGGVPEASPAFSFTHRATTSFGSFGELLRESTDPHQGMSNFNPVPDQVLDNVGMGSNQQSYSQQNYNVASSAATSLQQTAPNQVYSVPVDQLSASGITFAVPLATANQSNTANVNGMTQNTQFCMPVQQAGSTGGGSGKVRFLFSILDVE
jgi:hypothetical protein